ncbi:hypothetical protein THAOC_36936 [Thalassiosira oceanica]|uniref:Uncharacterized protein n=1 Tax=Thalassiosira oceanica TaxID=159749 RepID=K0R100_THAOC|nr:hypothetical protein THAOC_36936 [Thalassiosira oceanica]|eukprot:EJK44514.1 hypothetical protein THAOC_36936 [Thalassiosira oceanica]
MGPLAVHAAILDEAAGRAVLELDGVAPCLAAVGAGFSAVIAVIRNGHANRHAAHRRPRSKVLVICRKTGESGGERAMSQPHQHQHGGKEMEPAVAETALFGAAAAAAGRGKLVLSPKPVQICSTSDSRSVAASHLSVRRFVRWLAPPSVLLCVDRGGVGGCRVLASGVLVGTGRPPARASARRHAWREGRRAELRGDRFDVFPWQRHAVAVASGMPRGRLSASGRNPRPRPYPPCGSAGTAVIAWGIGAVDSGKNCQSSVSSRRPVTARGRHVSSCRDVSALGASCGSRRGAAGPRSPGGEDDGKGAEVEKAGDGGAVLRSEIVSRGRRLGGGLLAAGKKTDLSTTGQHQLALDPYHRPTLPIQGGCSFGTCGGAARKGGSWPAGAPRGATPEPTVLVQVADREERGGDFRRLDAGVKERVIARWSERGVEAGGGGDRGPEDAALRHGFPQRAKEAMLGPGP